MNVIRRTLTAASSLALVFLGDVLLGAEFGPVEVSCSGQPAQASSATDFGFFVFSREAGAQVAVMPRARTCLVSVRQGEEAVVSIPVKGVSGGVTLLGEVFATGREPAEVDLSPEGKGLWQTVQPGRSVRFGFTAVTGANQKEVVFRLKTRGRSGAGEAAVEWRNLQLQAGKDTIDLPLTVTPGDPQRCPPPILPALRPAIEQALVEWDWRMQDGIGTERAPSTYAAAIERALDRGELLIRDLGSSGVAVGDSAALWKILRREWKQRAAQGSTDASAWENLWRRVHVERRRIALANPLAPTGPIAFVKHVPSMFSHQLTQYTGNCARPGGGLFVLERPGQSMECRQLATPLPSGSYQFADVSHDGRRILFAFCHTEDAPRDRELCLDRVYHLYEVNADGSGLRQLTDGAFDDLAGRYLPDGKIVFVSTRRQGFHRCGRGPCPTHTLALCNADGSNPRVISYHETHEWDPVVLHDGRVLYTRWDYVDRHAVHYQQLWSVRPDGSDVRVFYGNNTLNPVGVWEARPVPGSNRVIATAGAHHAMTAGSIILLDTSRGVDGLDPIARLTPDALFPESEAPVAGTSPGAWHAPVGVLHRPAVPADQQRWPGHCYRTPLPLSENYFLAAYSFDRLVGEPVANQANMFGLYLVDRFGNKELLYRDLNVSSLWPMPLQARAKPQELPSVLETAEPAQGTFFMQNVYVSWPQLPAEKITRLRVVQVLPKSTWHANDPMVGLANASPGKQVLGTVPVEADGSAFFRAPARTPLAFQALDEQGQAVQTMRSITYLQPGENVSCVGCHEPRNAAPPQRRTAQALSRAPSAIEPGPEGSNPLSYPILVQPVLEKHCVACHKPGKAEGGVLLTGEPQGQFTASYNALVRRVPYSDWAGKPGDFRLVNSEPLTRPEFFGSRNSDVMKLLHKGHYDVKLAPEEYQRLATWMDTNALFYGTFDKADQVRQQRGERIAGPKVQ